MSAFDTGEEGTQSNQKDEKEENKPLWQFVTKLPRLNKGGGNIPFKCDLCGISFTGSYSRVKAHLLKIKGEGIRPCISVTAKKIQEMEKLVSEAEAKALRSRPKEISASGSASRTGGNKLFLDGYDPRKRKAPSGSPLEKAFQVAKRDELKEEIARMFYTGGLPFNLAKNPHYIKAFKLAAENNLDGFVPPGYNMLRTVLLQKERASVDNALKPIRETWNSKGVTLVSDGWSDSQRRPLLNFIAISENGPMFLKAVNYEAQYKDKFFISKLIVSAIADVGHKNVIQVITDNALVCKAAGLLVEAQYPHVFWTPCVVHTLNLALKNICAAKNTNTKANEVTYHECHWITEIAGEASFIKNFIYNHSMRLAMFNRFVKLKLLAIAETRFASVIIMLRRFKRVKNALQSLVISDEWNAYKEDDHRKASIVKEKVLDDNWWINVDYILDFTDPMYEMLRVLDTDKSSLHLVYEMWGTMISKVRKVIYHHEKKQETEESSFWNVVDNILHDRWKKSSTPLHCLAHSLNPRYYSPAWVNTGVHCIEPHKDQDISDERAKCIQRLFPDPDERREVIVEFAKFSSLINQFGETDSIRDRMNLDPKMWWFVHGSSGPKIQALAMKLLCQPCSSSCCERNWSTYAFIHSLKRNKLAPQRAKDLVFVHQNLRLLSRTTPNIKKATVKCGM